MRHWWGTEKQADINEHLLWALVGRIQKVKVYGIPKATIRADMKLGTEEEELFDYAYFLAADHDYFAAA